MSTELPVVDENDRPFGKSGYTGANAKELARQASLKRDVVLTDELFITVCDRLAQGEPLVRICADRTMPSMRQVMWRLYKDEKAKDTYYAAREMGMEALIEEGMAIAFDDSEDNLGVDSKGRYNLNSVKVQRDRLKTDFIKYTAGKMAPKRFGDKTQTEISGDPTKPVIMRVVTGVPRAAGSLIGGNLPAPKIIEGDKIIEGEKVERK